MDISETSFSNTDLYKRKISLIDKILHHKGELPYSVKCLYHGIPISFNFNTKKETYPLQNYLPPKWKIYKSKNFLNINCYSPSEFSFSPDEWSNEPDPGCHIIKINNAEIAIQRDFVGIRHDSSNIDLIFNNSINDGFYNSLRWLLPRRMLEQKKIVLHSSCFIGLDGLAYFFLGPSGAGKSTLVSLAKNRVILGDDMNILSIKDNNYLAEAGALGGIINNTELLNQSFPVGGFFWLHKNNRCQKQQLLKSTASLKFVASCSNLFWNERDKYIENCIMNYTTKIVNTYPFYNLEFTKTDEFLEYVDGKYKN